MLSGGVSWTIGERVEINDQILFVERNDEIIAFINAGERLLLGLFERKEAGLYFTHINLDLIGSYREDCTYDTTLTFRELLARLLILASWCSHFRHGIPSNEYAKSGYA